MSAIVPALLLCCFIWAIVATTNAAEWRAEALDQSDRADRAEDFAEDCLAELNEARLGRRA